MEKKFAYLEINDTFDHINIKPKIIKKLPKKIFDYYMMKTNPYVISEETIVGCAGYKIILPAAKSDITNTKKMETLIAKTVADLEKSDVAVLKTIDEYESFTQQILQCVDGKVSFCFLLTDAIKKALKLFNKELKYARTVIIDAPIFITDLAIELLYQNVNHFVAVTERESYFAEKADYIYEDAGLLFEIVNKNAYQTLREADIIINCSGEDDPFMYKYKKNAIYFAPVKPNNFNDLCDKREDMLIADSLQVKLNGRCYPLYLFEAALFIKHKEIRRLFSKKIFYEDLLAANDVIKQYEPSISGLCKRQNVITPRELEKLSSKC